MLVGLLMFEIDAADAPELDSMLFENYLNGLGDIGWQGDPQTVRLGYIAGIAAKYLELVGTVSVMVNEESSAMLERVTGHSVQDNRRQSAGMFRFALNKAAEARELMKNSPALA